MGSLFQSKAKAVSDPGATEAWNLAKPYQQQALSGMGTLAGQVAANPAYDGQRVADLNPYQTGSADALGSFAGTTSPYAYNMTNQGLNTLGSAAGVGDNYNMIFGRSSMDPTQQIIGQAGMYANNPYVDGVVDAANRDTVRGLTEQQLPSLMRGMVGTGNTNNTAGMKEGQILTRGAQDRMADTSNTIRSQFFGQGLNMAQNQYNQSLQNMLQANQGLLGAGQFGSGLMGLGQQYASGAFGQGQAAGGVDYAQQQALLDAQRAQFNETWQNPLSVYGALSGSASGATGVKTTAGVVQQPSIASQIGGGLMAAGSLGWKPFG
jgi:hypothetical protein